MFENENDLQIAIQKFLLRNLPVQVLELYGHFTGKKDGLTRPLICSETTA